MLFNLNLKVDQSYVCVCSKNIVYKIRYFILVTDISDFNFLKFANKALNPRGSG